MKLIHIIIMLLCFGTSITNSSPLSEKIKIRKKIRLQTMNQLNDENFNAEKIEILSQKRRDLIIDIKRFIREASDKEQKAELNLRLGNLYIEDYYGNLAKAQMKYEKDMKKYKKSNKKGQKKIPTFDSSEAMASLEKARAIYLDLVKKYINHPRRDEMLYFLGLTSLDSGYTIKAMQYLKALVEEFPKSQYSLDALIQLGDYYFDKNNFSKAMGYYESIIKTKEKNLLLYAMYKKAWCEYNLGQVDFSLKHFKWVIENEPKIGTRQVKVRNEALKDITLPFVDLKLLETSINFFKQFETPIYRDALSTMASLYFERGQYQSAIHLYNTLLSIDSNWQKNPDYDIQIVECLILTGNLYEGVKRLFSTLPSYTPKSTWYELNASNPQIVASAMNLYEETAKKHAFRIHQEAQKTKSHDKYEIAKFLYSKYIEYFPSTNHSSKVRFFLAEILYKQEKFMEAAHHYYLVYKDNSAGELRLDGIRYALNSLDRQLNLERKKLGLDAINNKLTKKLKESENSVLEKIPYSKVEESFIQVATQYIKEFSKEKDIPDVIYEKSYIHYIHHEFEDAFSGFWTITNKFSRHETAESSAHLILDILNRQKNYPKLISACKIFLKTFNNHAFRTEVADILRHAELKRIQILEEKNLYEEAADNYVEYTKIYGPEDMALYEKALYNAAVNYGKANKPVNAVEVQEKFLRRFPKSPLIENMLLHVAKTHESLANYEKAAKYYDDFATQYPFSKQAPNALRFAGLYYWGTGSKEKAESIMKKFIVKYPEQKSDVEKDLLALYESEDDIAKQLDFYEKARFKKGISYSDYLVFLTKIIELETKKRSTPPFSLMEEALDIVNKYKKSITSSQGIEAMAKVLYYYASKREEIFRNIQLVLPQKRLEANLKKKLELAKDVEENYKKILSLGNLEWGLASLYSIAASYRHLAQSILAAPVPNELTGEQLEIYRKELDKEMITPFNEKALEFAEQCLDKGQELKSLNIWTSKCYSLASQLRASRYPIVRTYYLLPLKVALLIKKDDELPSGRLKKHQYPFYSPNLFGSSEMIFKAEITLPNLYGNENTNEDPSGITPQEINYGLLKNERKNTIRSMYEAEKPTNENEITLSYLNLLRLMSGEKAIELIKKTIQKHYKNYSLHNLLALSYLDVGNYNYAKIIWLSLLAQGINDSAILNNLGVLSYLENNEQAAISYFNEATKTQKLPEAFSNLGFIALKYRNGTEAKKYFTRAFELGEDSSGEKTGLAVAYIQGREWKQAKELIYKLIRNYKTDPYTRITAAYYLLDFERKPSLSRQLLREYMDIKSAENDPIFRSAYQETRKIASTDTLPDIE